MFTEDQRDRSAFPNFEGGGLTFEQHLPTVGSSSDPNVSLHLDDFCSCQLSNLRLNIGCLASARAVPILVVGRSSSWI